MHNIRIPSTIQTRSNKPTNTIRKRGYMLDKAMPVPTPQVTPTKKQIPQTVSTTNIVSNDDDDDFVKNAMLMLPSMDGVNNPILAQKSSTTSSKPQSGCFKKVYIPKDQNEFDKYIESEVCCIIITIIITTFVYNKYFPLYTLPDRNI